MYSVIKAISMVSAGEKANYVEAACLSTDTKPTDGIANESLCLEMNTGDFYYFDGAAKDWNKIGE